MEFSSKLSKLRKRKKMSIKKIAEKLGINERCISDWESGKTTPTLKQVKQLASIYDIQVSELIDENEIVDDLIKEKKYNTIKIIIILVLLISLSIIVSLFVHRERYQEMEIYSFIGESDNFKFKNGLVVISRDNKFIELGKFEIKNKLKLKSATINIAFNENLWIVRDYDENEDVDVKDWFKDIDISEYVRKGNLLENKDNQDSFTKYETKFPNDFKVEINYCTIDDKCTVEILSIKSEKLNTINNEKK